MTVILTVFYKCITCGSFPHTQSLDKNNPLRIMRILWIFLSSSLTVNWISLGCGYHKTFEDVIFHQFLVLWTTYQHSFNTFSKLIVCVIVSACCSPAAVSVRSLCSLGCRSAAFGIPGRSSRAPSYAGLPHWGQRWTQSSSPLCIPLGARLTTLSSSSRTVLWTAKEEAPSLYPEWKETNFRVRVIIKTPVLRVPHC